MRSLSRGLMVFVALLSSVIAYTGLPERVPLRWNLSGEVERYGSRWALFLMPLIMIAVWALFRFLPRIDPLRANYAKFAGSYEVLIDAVLGMMLVVHAAVLLGAGGAPASVVILVRLAVGALFIVLGNVMPRTRQNWFIGVRTPWTLASPRVWERTHRLAGYLFVLLGILVIGTVPLSPRFGMPILAAAIFIVVLGTAVYSYLEWRKEQPG